MANRKNRGLSRIALGGAGMRLLATFRKWAENRGAVELSAGVNSGVALDKIDRFLQRLGFQRTGGNYSLSLIGKDVPSDN